MPVYKDTADDYSEEQVKDIEKLLDYVNAVDTNLVLRLGEEYYGKFKWFGETSSSKKSYFSYQEEAVYNFIFDLNKSGILSDQVGMGKTIEAGMIISELASRKELKSLLIIVPNEIMSSKWKQELEDKFGIKPVKGFDEYPSVTVIRNYDDFCLCAFECLKQDKFATLENIDLGHEYKKKADDTLAGVLQTYIKSDIKKVVDMINDSFEIDDMKERVTFDGKKFALKGTNIQRDYVYDANGVIDDFVNKYHNMRLEVLLNLPQFSDDYRKLLEVELSGAYTLIGDYFLTNGKSGDVSSMTAVMTKRHPILVVPISYAGKDGKSVDFLNRTLMKAADNYKHRYIVRNGRTDGLDFVRGQPAWFVRRIRPLRAVRRLLFHQKVESLQKAQIACRQGEQKDIPHRYAYKIGYGGLLSFDAACEQQGRGYLQKAANGLCCYRFCQKRRTGQR